jgi:hypothetical protein
MHQIFPTPFVVMHDLFAKHNGHIGVLATSLGIPSVGPFTCAHARVFGEITQAGQGRLPPQWHTGSVLRHYRVANQVRRNNIGPRSNLLSLMRIFCR